MSPANRLAQERSPYLLQHAHNPVDWHAWGDEAFEKARREGKPVFLSIGYSACHWCHVMERESFEDEATARDLNAHFVSVKVDREERPDIDQIYQLAHQVLTQRAGGWPLSMFLTPDRKPFYGGTYFPNTPRHGMPSFRTLLEGVTDAFAHRRGDVDAQADELTRVVARVTGVPADERAALDPAALDEVRTQLMRRAAPTHGGFGRAPKFPNTMALDLLLLADAVRGDTEARAHALVTLDHMAAGGIHDQLGGGFARYSTDERWLIPHFEKMLYDNAQLARVYLDGWRARGTSASETDARGRDESVVRDTLTYVLREMRDDASGAFYSAQDADSEGVEGKFFAWTPASIEAVIGAKDARVVCRYFDVTPEGNFEHGLSALWTPEPVERVAKAVGLDATEVLAVIRRARPALFAARELRVKPMRDDKCLASWNALVIGSLADAGATLGETTWTDAASRGLRTWRERGFTDGRLAHAMKDGVAYGTGYLDDYAGLACAAIDVYEATFEPETLAFARALADAALDLFWDADDGSAYYTPRDAEVVIQRVREVHDHAYPGGYGLVADALLRLTSLTGESRYRTAAERLLEGVASMARQNPMGLGTVARAIDRAARGAVEIVVLGDTARDDTRALLRVARASYVPHRVLACASSEDAGRAQGLDPALLRARSPGPDGAPQVFVCRGTVCEAPVQTPEALRAALTRSPH